MHQLSLDFLTRTVFVIHFGHFISRMKPALSNFLTSSFTVSWRSGPKCFFRCCIGFIPVFRSNRCFVTCRDNPGISATDHANTTSCFFRNSFNTTFSTVGSWVPMFKLRPSLKINCLIASIGSVGCISFSVTGISWSFYTTCEAPRTATEKQLLILLLASYFVRC
jgi:hypothetical protein